MSCICPPPPVIYVLLSCCHLVQGAGFCHSCTGNVQEPFTQGSETTQLLSLQDGLGTVLYPMTDLRCTGTIYTVKVKRLSIMALNLCWFPAVVMCLRMSLKHHYQPV